jgi:hypothetical protein
MPTWRYRTEGVPARAAAALTPLPSTNPIASSWGLVHTVGAPSTLRVPSPRPQSTRGFGALGVPGNGGGYTEDDPQPSAHAPDYILPSLYWTEPTPQMTVHASNNEIPIPAVSSVNTAPGSSTLPSPVTTTAVVQRPRRMGGLLVTAWPKVAAWWPTFGSGRNNVPNSGQIN